MCVFYLKIRVLWIFFATWCFIVNEAKPSHKKVLILGAGLSGIVAGKTLLDNGIDDFLVLEGQDYIGGRIKQEEFAGYKLESGASWIHFYDDEETAPIWKAKLKANMAGIVSNYENVVVRNEKGQNITDMETFKRISNLFTKVESAQESRVKAKKSSIPARVGLSLMGWKPKTAVDYAAEWLEIDFENSKKAELVPFQGIFEKGADFYISDERGMWTMFEDFYANFTDKIKLNVTVTEIRYNSSIVQVTTSDGEVYTADFALCTFSTGVLASDLVTFSPPMPDWKKEAILTMPMSVYTKIFLKFPEKFWDDKEFILYSGKARKIAAFQDLQRPGLYPNNSGLLLASFTGEEGRRIESQTLEETKKELVTMLREIYGQNVSEPTDIYIPSWTKNKYIRGAYSEGTVGMSSKTFEHISKNLGRLYFSGEATNEDWYGYIQSAYITGEEQAKNIVKEIQCQKTPNAKECLDPKSDGSKARICPLMFLIVSLSYYLI